MPAGLGNRPDPSLSQQTLMHKPRAAVAAFGGYATSSPTPGHYSRWPKDLG